MDYLRRIYRRYRQSSRSDKERILDEFCQVTRYYRKYALRLLNGPEPSDVARPRRRRAHYGPATVAALKVIWEAANYPWSVRLKALLPDWLPWAKARGMVNSAIEQQLLAMSPRQMDRRLQAHRRVLKKRLYGRTKPGTLRKHPIPLRTDRWRVRTPGFTEIDLVAHCGNRGDGEFLHSLNVTDIHTTWVETRAVLGKARTPIRMALEDIRAHLPFRLRGIDSDNGSEFINDQLLRYSRERRIQFTRGRPYKKDDNAHVEQKNWTHVRKLLGYVRYDSPAAQAAIHALYRHELRLFQNLFLPSVKLLAKQRVGARVRRRYDAPRTPLQRVLACPEITPQVAAELQRQRDRLDPFALAAALDTKLQLIFALANPNHRPPASAEPPAPVAVRRRVRPRLSSKPVAQGAASRPSSSVTSRAAR